MNKNNKNLLLIVILMVLAIAAYFLTTERGEKTSTYKLEEKLFIADSSAVDKFEIEYRGKKITIEKKGINWMLTSPAEYLAYQPSVANALSTLKNYKISSKLSDNPGNKDRYGFNDTNYTRINVYQGGNSIGQIMVGNAGSGASQSYIKRADGNEIFLADDFLWNNIVKNDLNEWRDKLIIAIPKASVKSIDFLTPTENYTLTADSTGKYWVGKDSAVSTVTEGIANILSNLNTQGFKDTLLTDASKFIYTAKVNWNNAVTEIKLAKEEENPSNQKYLMVVSGVNQVFEVDENYLRGLFKSRKEMLGVK
jgi:hypothetical protein